MKNEHAELKFGITGKMVSGIAYGSVSSGPVAINIDPTNTIFAMTGNVTAQYSSNLDQLGAGGSIQDALNHRSGKGWGGDLGFVYEVKKDGDPTQEKFRLGFSITDLGQMKYNNSPDGATYSMQRRRT